MNVEKSLPVMEKKYKLVPPDGGWGYVICVAVTVNFVSWYKVTYANYRGLKMHIILQVNQTLSVCYSVG